MNNCNHILFLVKTDVDYSRSNLSTTMGTYSNSYEAVDNSIHAVVVCAYCGHVRKLYADGRVVVVKDFGEVSYYKNDTTIP